MVYFNVDTPALDEKRYQRFQLSADKIYHSRNSVFVDITLMGSGEVAGMLFGKKGQVKKEFDRENKRPVLKCSICNGEQVAGFKDVHTGKFEEVMFIRNAQDLEAFKEMYSIEDTEIAKEY